MTAHNNGTNWDRPSKPWAIPGGRKVTSADASREAWLAERSRVIGGSDVAVLFGQGYVDEWTLWADKTGRAPEREATAAMDRGRLMEQGVIDLWALHYAEHPIELQRAGLIVSRRFPHLGATVDRLSICPLGRCVVEAKTQADSREWEGDDGEPIVPVKFSFQGQAQLLATGRDHVHYVVMGPRFVPFERLQYADLEFQEFIGRRVEAWWDVHIADDVAPAATERSRPQDIYRAAEGMKYILDEEGLALADSLPALKADADAAKANYEAVVKQLQALVGPATEIIADDERPVATWRPSRTIDGVNAAFRKAHPDLVAQYAKPAVDVDVAALVADHPELIAGDGPLRYRRTWKLA